METIHLVTGSRGEDRGAQPVPRVALAHPTGNQFFRHLAVALRDAGLLGRAFTCIDWRGGVGMDRLLPAGVRLELGRRSFSRELAIPVSRHPWREAVRLASLRFGIRRLTAHEVGAFSVDAVFRDFDHWVARELTRAATPGVVYAYEDAAEQTFASARQNGWRCVYDLPIAYWETSQRLLGEEAQRLPEWEPTLVGTRDSEAKLERKSRELRMADLVVCPSRFVADSLPDDPGREKRVLIAPFGSPGMVPESRPRNGGPLRILFAGSMTQRKGLADLFAAMKLMARREVELVVMGSPIADLSFYRRQGTFTYEPPRPHRDVLRLMAECDVLCLPSIVEGRALVVQEAMSTGLPVVVTENTGTADVVTPGLDGFVVPIRSPGGLADRLTWFAEHRRDLPEMRVSARRAAARLTWANYGQAIIASLMNLR